MCWRTENCDLFSALISSEHAKIKRGKNSFICAFIDHLLNARRMLINLLRIHGFINIRIICCAQNANGYSKGLASAMELPFFVCELFLQTCSAFPEYIKMLFCKSSLFLNWLPQASEVAPTKAGFA